MGAPVDFRRTLSVKLKNQITSRFSKETQQISPSLFFHNNNILGCHIIDIEPYLRYFIYNEKVAPVERIVSVQGVPLLQRKDGVIIVLAPLDHVTWTQKLWLKGSKGSGTFNKLPGFSGKEVWITGAFDPMACKALEIEGWKVEEDFASKFLTEK